VELTEALFFPTKTLVSLRDRTSGSSQWVEPGQSFNDYTFVAYDPAAQLAVVTRAGETHRLPLTDSKSPFAETPDLHQRPLEERRLVWERVKNLEGPPLVEALVRHGDRTMQTLVGKVHASAERLKVSQGKVAEALSQSAMTARKKAALKVTDTELADRVKENQTLLDQGALALKSMLQLSLGP
jgi:hypothetical protein